MADERQPPENDELLLTDQVDGADDKDQDDPDGETDAGDDVDVDDPDGGEQGDEEVLTFGDDLTDEKPDDSNLIKHLRDELKRARKAAKEAAEATAKPEPIDPGPEPQLEDFNYDSDEYKKALREWDKKVAAAERQTTQTAEARKKEAEAWQAELDRYNQGKTSLGYADVSEAEETVVATLNEVQQAVLVKAADNPARVMYALGKHPDRLTQLASISDPLKLAAAVARLEGQLKVVKKRKAPDPEQIERGSGSVSTSRTDKQLEKLQREAEKTGDYSKVLARKRELKAAGKA